jgi:hypothetical protein
VTVATGRRTRQPTPLQPLRDVGVRARSHCARSSDLMPAWTRLGDRKGRLRCGVGARRRAARRAYRRRHGKEHTAHQAIPDLSAEHVVAQWMEPM